MSLTPTDSLEDVVRHTIGTWDQRSALTEDEWERIRQLMHHVPTRESLRNISTNALRRVCPAGLFTLVNNVKRHLEGKATQKQHRPIPKDALASYTVAEDAALQRALMREMQHREINPDHIRGLKRLCTEIGSFHNLMSMDATKFKALLHDPRHKRVVHIVRLAYIAEGGNPDVVARCSGSQMLTDNQPVLCDWPPAWGAWMEKHIPQHEDREHVMQFLCALDEHNHRTKPTRSRQNSRRSLCDRAKVLFGTMGRMLQGTSHSYRTIMPYGMDTDQMTQFLAELVHTWHSHAEPTYKRKTQRISQSPMAKVLVTMMKTATKVGLFPNVVMRRSTFRLPDVYAAIQTHTDPEELAAREDSEAHVGARRCRPPSEDTVEKLREVARGDPRKSLFLALLTTTGLRLRAITQLTIHHLWDAKRNTVNDEFVVVEKNSERRTIRPNRELREAIERFVGSKEGRSCLYVMSQRVRARLPPNCITLRRYLEDMCRTAGVPVLNPHAFRSYLITTLRQRGVEPEVACKFIGHKTIHTQNTYYWKENLEAVTTSVLTNEDANTVRGMRRRIQDAQEQLAALKMQRERLLMLRAPPPSTRMQLDEDGTLPGTNDISEADRILRGLVST